MAISQGQWLLRLYLLGLLFWMGREDERSWQIPNKAIWIAYLSFPLLLLLLFFRRDPQEGLAAGSFFQWGLGRLFPALLVFLLLFFIASRHPGSLGMGDAKMIPLAFLYLGLWWGGLAVFLSFLFTLLRHFFHLFFHWWGRRQNSGGLPLSREAVCPSPSFQSSYPYAPQLALAVLFSCLLLYLSGL